MLSSGEMKSQSIAGNLQARTHERTSENLQDDAGVPVQPRVAGARVAGARAAGVCYGDARLLKSLRRDRAECKAEPYEKALYVIPAGKGADFRQEYLRRHIDLYDYIFTSQSCPYPLEQVPGTLPGKLYLGMCPGRFDNSMKRKMLNDRDIEADLQTIRQNHINTIVCAIPWTELEELRVESYIKCVTQQGLELLHYAIADERGSTPSDMEGFRNFIRRQMIARLKQGRNVLVHCRNGEGRSATIVACTLVQSGLYSALQAEKILTDLRGEACPKKQQQRAFVYAYEKAL